MDITPILVGIFLLVIFVIIGTYIATATRWKSKERYTEELERLDKQLKDKQINQETHDELKRNFERKYKWFT